MRLLPSYYSFSKQLCWAGSCWYIPCPSVPLEKMTYLFFRRLTQTHIATQNINCPMDLRKPWHILHLCLRSTRPTLCIPTDLRILYRSNTTPIQGSRSYQLGKNCRTGSQTSNIKPPHSPFAMHRQQNLLLLSNLRLAHPRQVPTLLWPT